MSRSIPYRADQIAGYAAICRAIKENRRTRKFEIADFLRSWLLGIDTGMRVTIDRAGKVSLFHWPEPAFDDQFHYANYGEFQANSERVPNERIDSAIPLKI